MKKVDIAFKEAKIENVAKDLNSFDILFTFLADSKLKGIVRNCKVKDNTEMFVQDFLNELKNKIKEINHDPYNEDIFDLTTINIIEKEEGNAEERLITAVKKMKDQVRTLKGTKIANDYMNNFFKVRDYKIKL